MRDIQHCLRGIVLILLAVLAAQPAAAQSQNPQAQKWFEVGLSRKEPEKKVEAYLRAIEQDPEFVEALFNLGLAYKKQQDYERAALYFQRAQNTKPELTKKELRSQILLELATTYRKLDKVKDSEQVLREAKGLTDDRATRAAILFELGRLYFEQGRHEESLVELKAGAGVSTANAGQFKTFIQLVEREIELQRLFTTAHRALNNKELEQAKNLIEQIRAKSVDRPNLTSAIAKLDSLLQHETQNKMLADWYDEAEQSLAQGDLAAGIAGFEKILQQAGAYKDTQSKLEAARQQLAQKQVNEQLENEYTTGMAALNVHDWIRAIISFEKILEIDANFRDVRQRLEEAQGGLERESTETIVARYYAEGVAAMNSNDLGGALVALEKVRKLNPGYRNVVTLLQEVEKALQNKAAPQIKSEVTVAASAKMETLYQEAQAALGKEDWVQAVVALEALQLLQPDYRDAADLLAQARSRIEASHTIAERAESQQVTKTPLYVGGAIAALIVLPLLGFIAFSPTTRARIYFLRGNYAAAAQLYENILAARPDRVKLYPLLANIYLLLGRRDEQAMKVYQTILQLKIATHAQEEINSIVAQKFLTEGRTDSDAIDVLESALKLERQKQNLGTY